MPVKIVGGYSDSPKEITLNEYQAGRDNFDSHYFVRENDENKPFGGQDFYFAYSELQLAVDNFCIQNSKQPQDVAIRFVHCYNHEQDVIYMRMQILTMTNPGAGGLPPNEQGLIPDPCAWYIIQQGSIQTTTICDLEDMVYLQDFYYYAGLGGDYQKLADGPDTYVKNLTYPWYTEILAMYEANGSPLNAMIHFAACSYIESPMQANVTFPHGNVLYLSVNDVPLLDNDDWLVIFKYKGCDNASLCPPNCGVYVNVSS